jgi:hypothetical protein
LRPASALQERNLGGLLLISGKLSGMRSARRNAVVESAELPHDEGNL